MSDTALRYLDLLQAIPRAPQKRDVASLHRMLEAAGYRLSLRQVQRDLNILSQKFAIRSDEPGPGLAGGWSWDGDANPLELPGMDGQTALALKMMEQFIPTLMPPSVVERLKPYFDRANDVLKSSRGNGLARWTDCVRVVPRTMPLLPPKFDKAAVRVVYEALLAGRQFKVMYRGRAAGDAEPAERVVHPLGLVVRDNLIYLVCTLWNYTDVRHLALHRMSRAQMLGEPAKRPPGFTIDEHINSGEFQYPEGGMVRLKVRFDKDAAAHLAETPLSKDQVIVPGGEGHAIVTATVLDSQQLVWWLRGFGTSVVIIGPTELAGRI